MTTRNPIEEVMFQLQRAVVAATLRDATEKRISVAAALDKMAQAPFEAYKRGVEHAAGEAAKMRNEIAELELKIAALEDRCEMACIEPDPACECAGCLYARQKHGAGS